MNQLDSQYSKSYQSNQHQLCVHGLVIPLDELTVSQIVDIKILNIIEAFQLQNVQPAQIPSTNIEVQVNSLMDLKNEIVSKDVSSWLNYNSQLINSNNEFSFIRYFYFHNTESYNKNSPQKQEDYGKRIVKYKNQIVVLVGIFEKILNQPIQYFGVFKKIHLKYKEFQKSDELNSSQTESFMNTLLYLIKQRLINSQNINKQFCRYLNSNKEPLGVLMSFVRFLFKSLEIDYKSEDMSIFYKQFQVQVLVYSQQDSLSQINVEQPDMTINIIYERISNDIYDFKNCYLLYDSSFKDSFDDIPFKCWKCLRTNLNSYMYVNQDQNQRICFQCQ